MKTKSELTAEQKASAIKRQKMDIIRFFIKLLLVISVGVVTFGFVFGIVIVPDDAMRPVMRGGDIGLFYRNPSAFKQNDIVVCEIDGKLHCARISATSGDTVNISDDGKLIINGSAMVEQDIFYPTSAYQSDVVYPVLLNEGEYFLLGDYRNNAKDSRFYGAIPADNIKGKIITIIRRNNL